MESFRGCLCGDGQYKCVQEIVDADGSLCLLELVCELAPVPGFVFWCLFQYGETFVDTECGVFAELKWVTGERSETDLWVAFQSCLPVGYFVKEEAFDLSNRVREIDGLLCDALPGNSFVRLGHCCVLVARDSFPNRLSARRREHGRVSVSEYVAGTVVALSGEFAVDLPTASATVRSVTKPDWDVNEDACGSFSVVLPQALNVVVGCCVPGPPW